MSSQVDLPPPARWLACLSDEEGRDVDIYVRTPTGTGSDNTFVLRIAEACLVTDQGDDAINFEIARGLVEDHAVDTLKILQMMEASLPG